MARKLAPYFIARGIGDYDDALQEVLLAYEQSKDSPFPYKATWWEVLRTLDREYHASSKYQMAEGRFQRVVQEIDDELCEIVGVEDDRASEDVKELLAKLPDDEREIMERRLRGEKYVEIASALDMPYWRVLDRYKRAKCRIAGKCFYSSEYRLQKRLYYKKNRDKKLAKGREYRKLNRERLSAYYRDYYAKHREKRNRAAKENYRANREKILKRNREQSVERREEINAKRRERYAKRLEENRSYYRKRYRKQREKRLEYYRNWAVKHPEYQRKYYAEHREELSEKRRLRYAREKENAGKHNLGLASRSVDGVLPSAQRSRKNFPGALATNRGDETCTETTR